MLQTNSTFIKTLRTKPLPSETHRDVKHEWKREDIKRSYHEPIYQGDLKGKL